jgi:hypothetical protein
MVLILFLQAGHPGRTTPLPLCAIEDAFSTKWLNSYRRISCIKVNRYRPWQSLGLTCKLKDCFVDQSINQVGGRFMSKKAAEHHHKAAEHHEHAARHHKEAAKHHEAGKHETAAHHAHLAQGHHQHATHHAGEAAKAHIEDHGKASPAHA